MDYDCTDYSNCPKEIANIENFAINNEEFNFLFVGCWGVYGKQGEYKEENWNQENKKWKQKTKTYGQKSVVEAMKQFVEKNGKQQAVILAGDNVYSDSEIPLDDKFKNDIELYGKHYSYNMDKQFEKGFLECMAQVPTDHFLIGVGNHDIETCENINKQLKFSNWTMPGLSYKIMYENPEKMFNVNLIFIDTNMYKKKWCFKEGTPLQEQTYPKNAIQQQEDWLEKTLDKSTDTWNIVIGHIPFYCVSHKPPTNPKKLEIFNEDLYNLMVKYADDIDLYMCADEHNQQYITGLVHHDHKKPTYIDDDDDDDTKILLPPQVIAGSGGTCLDTEFHFIKGSVLEKATKHHVSVFGFVSVKVDNEKIIVNFQDNQENKLAEFDIDKKRF
jgi:hypothetical protein